MSVRFPQSVREVNLLPTRAMEKFRFDSYSSLLSNSILSGLNRVLLHVRCIPHQEFDKLFLSKCVWNSIVRLLLISFCFFRGNPTDLYGNLQASDCRDLWGSVSADLQGALSPGISGMLVMWGLLKKLSLWESLGFCLGISRHGGSLDTRNLQGSPSLGTLANLHKFAGIFRGLQQKSLGIS